MRIIQVVNVRWYNATAWYGVTLAHALQNAGHTSLVVGLAGSPALARARELGVETVGLPNSVGRLPWLWRDMDRLIREFQPDVVNCHRGESFILWGLLKRRHAFTLIRTRGDQRPPKSGLINRWLHGHMADALVATNSENARRFQENLGVDAAKIRIIIGGVDTCRFAPNSEARQRVRQEWGFGEQDFVMGLVGRMDEVKGIRETIFALGRTHKHIKNLWGKLNPRLLLIGFDSQYTAADVARWTAEAGLGQLGDIVHVTGKVERPEDYINALDLGVLASLGSEAIARAALEIMACRVALVSSRVGVMPDLLPPDCLFPPANMDAMATMFLKAANDNAWRDNVRQYCFQRIVCPLTANAGMTDALTLASFCDQTLDLYKNSSKCSSNT